MDARTTIAKDVLCALIASDGETEVDDRPCEYPQQYAVAAVEHADELLAQLTRTAKPTPPAQPAPKGPVWRKMTDPPSLPTCAPVANVVPNNELPFTGYFDGEVWHVVRGDGKGLQEKCTFDMKNRRWLDLNGFTPEVGE